MMKPPYPFPQESMIVEVRPPGPRRSGKIRRKMNEFIDRRPRLRRWLAHLDLVLLCFIWINSFIDIIYAIAILLQGNFPTLFWKALPKLWIQATTHHWDNLWDIPLVKIIVMLLFFLGGIIWIVYQTPKVFHNLSFQLALLGYRKSSPEVMRPETKFDLSMVVSYRDETTVKWTMLLPTASVRFLPVLAEEQDMLPARIVEDHETHVVTVPSTVIPELHCVIHVLHSFRMQLQGPEGTVDVIFFYMPHMELISYVADKGTATVQEILRDRYDCDEDATEEQEKKARNLFYNHHRAINILLNKAAKRAGLTEPLDLFQNERGGHSCWSLASWCQVADLPVLEQCQRLLAQAQKQGTIAGTDSDELIEACEAVDRVYTGDFLATQRRQYTLAPWYEEVIEKTASVYVQALTHLAHHAEARAFHTNQQTEQHTALRQAQRYWKDIALCCARVLYVVPARSQDTLSARGEAALSRCVELSRQLDDSLTALEVTQTYTHLTQDPDMHDDDSDE